MNYLSSIRNLLYPARCPVCDGVVSPAGAKICYECHEKLHIVREPRCMKCGKHLQREEREFCQDCEKNPHLYVRGEALYEYECIHESLYRFKYQGRREYADFYGEEAARYLGGQIRAWAPDALVPVPLHPERMRQRKYNQAQLIAEQIGKRMDIPVRGDLISRVRNTQPQKTLNPAERQNNLKRAFKIEQNDVKLKTIIIVDDIYTTGSTIDAICRTFEGTSVDSIYFLTLAIGRGI